MAGSKFGFATTLGLLLAAVGVIVPIAWDRYKSKTDLELQHLGTTTLLQADKRFDKLTITYDGRKISSLSKVDLALVNTGRTAIREADLIAPPTIRFAPSVTLLEVRREGVAPQNLTFAIASDPSALRISFQLLNPGDYIRLGVIVSGTPVSFSSDARVVGLTALRFVQKEQQVTERKTSNWLLLVVGSFTLVLFVGTLGLIAELKGDRKLMRAARAGTLLPPEGADKHEYILFVDTELRQKTNSEKQPLHSFLASQPEGALSPEERLAFATSVERILTKNTAREAVWVTAGLSAFGVYYLVVNLFLQR